MHHVVLDKWSRGDSLLHRRDPRGKVLGLLAFLIIVATTPPASGMAAAGYGAFLLIAVWIARLPLGGVLTRGAVVLPFSLAFAAMSLIEGDGVRALALVEKSYLSALAVVIVAGTTPMPNLLRGLESLGLPRFLLLVVQFLYRYLFVVSEQAQHMRVAAGARGALSAWTLCRRWRFRAAAGAVAVLFSRSYARADGIYRAMMARGFQGHIPLLATHRFGWSDLGFLTVAIVIPATLRFGLGA
ncbi:MAG: energy-coupling factor transporter transmembrane component T [Bryobacteraceae bacterium]